MLLENSDEKVGYKMKSFKTKKRNSNAQKVSLVMAVVLCAVSMFGIAMIYRNAVKKQENAKSLIETEDAGESELADTEEEESDAVYTAQDEKESGMEDIPEAQEAGVVDATRQEQTQNEVFVENIEVVESVNHFSSDSNLTWPVQGEVLMEYSMENPVYYSTLEQYGYSNGMVIQSERGQEVYSSADGTVSKVEYTDEYGWTVTVDLGDGYEATYGQLEEIRVSEGDSIVTGAVIAEVAKPSRKYTVEGDNLYFSLKQNENTVDPLDYLE